MGFQNVGKVWTPVSLAEQLSLTNASDWCSKITFHHTAIPSLAQRPLGFKLEHLQNLQHYYQTELHWSAGPHLFVDEEHLWGMTPFDQCGVHAKAFNRVAIGIEVLGDYDTEDPLVGRGLACWKNAAAAGRALLTWLGKPISEDSVTFHREDPDAHKTCPGKKVSKAWILQLMGAEPARIPDRLQVAHDGPWVPPPPPNGTDIVKSQDPRIDCNHQPGVLPCPRNPAPPEGWVYWSGAVPPHAVQLAVDVEQHYPLGSFVQATVDGKLIAARKEWHDYQGATGKHGCFIGTSLMRPESSIV